MLPIKIFIRWFCVGVDCFKLLDEYRKPIPVQVQSVPGNGHRRRLWLQQVLLSHIMYLSLVLESQLPHKIVDLLFTATNKSWSWRFCGGVGFLKLIDKFLSKCKASREAATEGGSDFNRCSYLTESVFEIVLQMSTPPQIRQLILHHYLYKEEVGSDFSKCSPLLSHRKCP